MLWPTRRNPTVQTTFRAVAVLGLAAAMLLAACGDDGEKVTAGSGGTPLEGTQWVLDLDTLGTGSTNGAQATLRLENGVAAGTDGCNQFNGGYTTDGDSLTFGQLATTQMMCTAELDAAGRKVLDGLAATQAYAISGSTLTLQDKDGTTVLTYDEASATGLVGEWQIIAYLDEAKQAFTSTLADPVSTVTFAEDGTVSGNAGCNDFSGTYSADATSITFSPLIATRKACTPEDVMTQEALVLADLQSATTWQTTSNGVDLFREDGTRVISLAKPA
jgi:heat shock protein HslJ